MDEMDRDPTTPETGYTEPSAAMRTATGGTATPPARRSSGKRFLWIFLAVVLAFLAGFGWQYYRAMELEDQLEQTEQALAVERLRVGLAQAAVAAQSGDFEAARRQMSEFFTATQERMPELRPEMRSMAEGLLRDRDEVITGLSRSNPEYATVLYEMLQRFQTSLEPAAATPGEPVTTPDTGVGIGAPAGG